MKITTALIVTLGVAGLAVAAAGCSSTLSGGGGSASHAACSDPHPNPNALTFAAVVCVLHESSVTQRDGSNELEVQVSVTDDDPNTFTISSQDFEVLDASGHDTPAENAVANGHVVTSACAYQSSSDNGWPIDPGRTFVLPESLCFDLPSGTQPKQLVWQSDVAVNLGPVAASALTSSPVAALGLPSGWQGLAIAAATSALKGCASATSANPPGCPQNLGLNIPAPVVSAQWTQLGSLTNAVAVAVDSTGAVETSAPPSQVLVFGRYSMDVSYTTTSGHGTPYLDYVGGLAEATMTWDGRSFQNTSFTGPGEPPTGVTVAPFTRPTSVDDATVLSAVAAAWQTCMNTPVSVASLKFGASGPPVPNCPMDTMAVDVYTTSARFVANTDPMQGAIASFDPDHGNFVVTGTFNTTLDYTVQGSAGYGPNGLHTMPVGGSYKAIVSWNGTALSVRNISAG